MSSYITSFTTFIKGERSVFFMKKKRNGAYQKLDNPSIEFIKKEVMDYKKFQII
ncbi:hypothetical protein GSP_23090 [Staphylococcus pseudintermedius]|nr:hypothetical protein GSP_23090 [Staphylococcus pseudintermedius]